MYNDGHGNTQTQNDDDDDDENISEREGEPEETSFDNFSNNNGTILYTFDQYTQN